MPGPRATPRSPTRAPRIRLRSGPQRRFATVARAESLGGPHDPSLARPFPCGGSERNPAGPVPWPEAPTAVGWRKLDLCGGANRSWNALAQESDRAAGSRPERPVIGSVRPTASNSQPCSYSAGHTGRHSRGGRFRSPTRLQSQDHAKLKHIAALLAPGLVLRSRNTGPFAKSASPRSSSKPRSWPSRNGAKHGGRHRFDRLAQGRPGPALTKPAAGNRRRHHRQSFLFQPLASTSLAQGRRQQPTAWPDQRTSKQARADLAVSLDEAPARAARLAAGGTTTFRRQTHNFNLVLRHAGTLYIDGGKPVGPHRRDRAQSSARSRPTGLFQTCRAGGLRRRCSAVFSNATRHWRAPFFSARCG